MTYLRLQNGAYVCHNLDNPQETAYLILAGTYGLRTPKETLLVSYKEDPWSVQIEIESKEVPIQRIAIVGSTNFSEGQRNKLRKVFGKALCCDIIYIDITELKRRMRITDEQLSWFRSVVDVMRNDYRFLLGQVAERQELESLEERINGIDNSIKETQRRLKNFSDNSEKELNPNTLKNIEQMQWIERLVYDRSGLHLLTKPMACSHVPNIAKVIRSSYIAKNHLFYRIMKYQFLGKYFIALPDWYIIDHNYGFKAEEIGKLPSEQSRTFIQKCTWFHGMICHAGNGNSCLGELAGSVAAAEKTGLDLYLMSIESYIRSINLEDVAGRRFYTLPMGDANGNIEVWPFLEYRAKKCKVSLKDLERTEQGYNDFLERWSIDPRLVEDYPLLSDQSAEAIQENMQMCLELIKSREPKVYEKIIERGVLLS